MYLTDSEKGFQNGETLTVNKMTGTTYIYFDETISENEYTDPILYVKQELYTDLNGKVTAEIPYGFIAKSSNTFEKFEGIYTKIITHNLKNYTVYFTPAFKQKDIVTIIATEEENNSENNISNIDLSVLSSKIDNLANNNTSNVDLSTLEDKIDNLTVTNNTNVDITVLEDKIDNLTILLAQNDPYKILLSKIENIDNNTETVTFEELSQIVLAISQFNMSNGQPFYLTPTWRLKVSNKGQNIKFENLKEGEWLNPYSS